MFDIGGIILAGGKSTRLGQNKALVELDGKPLVRHVMDALRPLVDEIVLVTNTPGDFAFLEIPMVADQYVGAGPLAGLHAGLSTIRGEYGLAVGCDMPFLNRALLEYMVLQRTGYDVVIPRIGDYYEPLHALYARHCLPTIESTLQSGQRRLLGFIHPLKVRYIKADEIDRFDPQRLSFFNLNSPGDLERMREIAQMPHFSA